MESTKVIEDVSVVLQTSDFTMVDFPNHFTRHVPTSKIFSALVLLSLLNLVLQH